MNKVFLQNLLFHQKNHAAAFRHEPQVLSGTKYKKYFGAWGESTLDTWMLQNDWQIHHKNLKLRHGEIDRIYKTWNHTQKKFNFCLTEIKTICCKNKASFFSFFTETGLSSLAKAHQIRNLYRFGTHLSAKHLQSRIYIRFFIILKLYKQYENESFFISQTTYKVCFQTSDYLILSFCPPCHLVT